MVRACRLMKENAMLTALVVIGSLGIVVALYVLGTIKGEHTIVRYDEVQPEAPRETQLNPHAG